MTLKERAYKHEFQLNDTDDQIIEYLIQNKKEIGKMSIQQIAAELFVAPNTIMRLARKLGYSGFAELKFSLQREDELDKETEKTISGELLGSLPANIARTLDVIDENALKEAADTIGKARCCILAGVGDSNYFCEMLGKNLRCVDVYVQYYTQIHDMIYAANHADKEDILVVISARGRNDRLLKMAENAKNRGIKVISITHFAENPLADIADIRLYFWGEMRLVQDYDVTDRSGLMVLIRLLSEEYWRRFTQEM